jgi:hypothetical protein
MPHPEEKEWDVAFDTQSAPISVLSTMSSPYLPHSEEIEWDPIERSLNAGKWSTEEKVYANRLVFAFDAGLLEDCKEGVTMRSYLSKKLRCAPMRISKKFARMCIGSKTFCRKVGDRDFSPVCTPPFQLLDCSQSPPRPSKRKMEGTNLKPRKRNQALSGLGVSSNKTSSQPSTCSRDCLVNSSVSALHSVGSNSNDAFTNNTVFNHYSRTFLTDDSESPFLSDDSESPFLSDDSESDSDISEDPIIDSDEYYEWSNALSYFSSQQMNFPPYAIFLESHLSC